jgi:hypothetical protein
MFSLPHDFLDSRQHVYTNSSHFCPAADECAAPWLIGFDCAVRTEYIHCTYEIQIKVNQQKFFLFRIYIFLLSKIEQHINIQ